GIKEEWRRRFAGFRGARARRPRDSRRDGGATKKSLMIARIEGAILKRALQIVGLAGVLALLAPLALVPKSWAQETHVTREGGDWGQEITGSLAGVKNLRVKVDMGSVVVRGGQQQGINYVIHTRFGSSSEQEARRQFEQYKVTAYVKGDTAWIVGDWQGSKRPRHCSSEFSVMVPREMALVKLETEGGNVETTGVTGRVGPEADRSTWARSAENSDCTLAEVPLKFARPMASWPPKLAAGVSKFSPAHRAPPLKPGAAALRCVTATEW